MKKFALILTKNNRVDLVNEQVNMTTTSDGYIIEIPLDSLVKVGDIYNPNTQEFTIVDSPMEVIE